MQTEEEMERQHQGMDRPGVCQTPEGSGEQRIMGETGFEVICGARTTPAVNGLLKVKLWNRSRWSCRCFSTTRLLTICSTVPLPGLEPARTSSYSVFVFSRVRITRSMILLGWLIGLMV